MENLNKNIKRVFKNGLTNFRRNSWLSLGTIGIMTLTLFILVSLFAFNVLSQNLISELEDKVDVSAYFKKGAQEKEIMELKSKLEELPSVKYVNYTSEERALEEFKRRHEGNELIQKALAEIEDNPLQASINIKAKDPSQFASIINFLENSKFTNLIDKVNYYENQTVIQRIQKISSTLRQGGILITLILSAIAVFVTFNTIRLTIYSQRQEIEIMRLVGASNWYIRGPFLVEGTIYGIFSAVISLAIFYPILYLISPKIENFTSSIDLFSYFVRFFPNIFILIIGSGIFLGVISSYIAIRRYLKI